MDYHKMPKKDLVQEHIKLRKTLEQIQGNEFIKSEYIKQGELIQSSPDEFHSELFIRVSPDLKYNFANEAYCCFIKQEREDFIGQSIMDSLPANFIKDSIDVLLSLSFDKPETSAEYLWTDAEGRAGWRRWTIRAIFDENNVLVEYQAVARDVTERKLAEEEIQRRLNIERAIANASKLLVGSEAPDLDEMLGAIGEAMAVNRIYIFSFHDDLHKMDNVYEWCDARTKSIMAAMQNIDTTDFSWGLSRLLRGEAIELVDLNSLPPEAAAEKESMEKQNINAALLVPILGLDEKLLGYIGFDDSNPNRLWKEEDVQCLKVLAELLGAYWERKKMVQALRASEAQFRTLTETAPAIIFVWQPDLEDSLLYLNTGYTSISGYSLEDALNTNYWDFVHPDFRSLLKARGRARLRGDSIPDRYESKFITKNGDELWGDLTLNTIEWDGKQAVIGVICDITEHKQMEDELRLTYDELEFRVIERTAELVSVNEKLRQEIVERQQIEQELLLSEARYRAIIEDQSELVLRMLPDKTITFVNEAYCKFFGKKAENFIGKSVVPTIYPDDQASLIAKLNIIGSRQYEDVHSLRAVRHDGEICWQEWTSKAIVKGTEILEIQAVGRDISARKRTEEALQRSEANFRKLADTSPALILVYTDTGFLYINSTFETMLGYTREELFKMTPWDPIHPDYQELCKQHYFARLNGEKVAPYEILLQCKDGQEIWGYLNADILDYEGQTATLGIIVDVTERKKMEEDLLQASKLDSLGILAGGIAHDFNNILTVISGNVSLAKMIMNDDDEVSEILTEVEQAALQARDLTQQLLTFSKGGAPIRETASIQDLLHETTSFVLRGSNVSCSYAIADDLWPASIDKGQISQVINNLIINADQAMPDGGIIQLSAENIYSLSDLPSSLKAGNYIKITIRDHGIGIMEKHLSKIFDPYFTTKQKGHGLGLATCYSIIKKHEGDINISSVIGSGTTIKIYLPAFPDQKIEQKNQPRLALQGQGKVLIMDDEAIVRDTLGKMLQRLGYTINTAVDGLSAIEQYLKAKQLNEPFDIVLMDLTIAGGMGGKEAVKKLLEIDPEAKVIVSSGYSNDPVMANFRQYGFCGILPKPYEIQAVNQILYELLDNQQAG